MLLFPDLPSLKLVEPGRDEGVVRVETIWKPRSRPGHKSPGMRGMVPRRPARRLDRPASRIGFRDLRG